MAEMLLVNPRRKKGRRRGRRRAMTAKQLQYFGPRRKRRRSRRRVAALAGPVVARKRSRRIRRSRRRAHRSTGGRSMRLGNFNPRSFINDTLMPAGVGAAGALGVDAAMGMLAPQLPAFLQTGIARTGVKLAAAVGIGMLAGMVAGKRFGEQAMAGAVTVTMYDLLKPYVAGVIPGVAGYDMGWVSPAPQIGAYMGTDQAYDGSMGVYLGETDNDYYREYVG